MTHGQWVALAYALSYILMGIVGMLAEVLRRAIMEGGKK